MPTQWFFPNAIEQYAEVAEHVSWSDNYYVLKTADLNFIGTLQPLLHISNYTVNDIKMKTSYLYLTEFNLNSLPEVISGIELELNMRRGGRITDDTIQLCYQGQGIGKNQATASLENTKKFGGETDLWEIDNLTAELLTDSSFGLHIRFQSHPFWPHRETPMVNYARLRVW